MSKTLASKRPSFTNKATCYSCIDEQLTRLLDQRLDRVVREERCIKTGGLRYLSELVLVIDSYILIDN